MWCFYTKQTSALMFFMYYPMFLQRKRNFCALLFVIESSALVAFLPKVPLLLHSKYKVPPLLHLGLKKFLFYCNR